MLGGATAGLAWPVYLIAAGAALTVGLFMPVFGISLAGLVVVDLVVSLRAARTRP